MSSWGALTELWTRHDGEGDDIRLACDKLWDEMPRLEGQDASEGPQLVALRCVGHTEAHLKSYRDEPWAPEVIEAKRKTVVEYFKGIKGYSSKKVTLGIAFFLQGLQCLNCIHVRSLCSLWKYMPLSPCSLHIEVNANFFIEKWSNGIEMLFHTKSAYKTVSWYWA